MSSSAAPKSTKATEIVTSPSGVNDSLLPVYARQGVTFVEGDGAWLISDDGRRYLDFATGIAVVGLGHRHAGPLQAAQAQLDRLWHASNLYWTEPMGELADRLSQRFRGAHAFFCNSGTEAVEAALKYARKSTGRHGVVSIEGSFHGRTLGALSVTGQPSKQVGFGPLAPGVTFARLNDSASLEAAVTPDIGLIIVEPILGEGGVFPAEAGFLERTSQLASEVGALVCYDEIQTGVGRTGTFFAFEQLGTKPALVTLAKGLANGLPIGCLLVDREHSGGFQPGDHGSTFGGNPVACAAAVAVCDNITDELLQSVRSAGDRVRQGLDGLSGVRAVRGAGLLLAFDVEFPAGQVVAECLRAGLCVTSAGEHTIRLTPPLTVTADEIDLAVELLSRVLA